MIFTLKISKGHYFEKIECGVVIFVLCISSVNALYLYQVS